MLAPLLGPTGRAEETAMIGDVTAGRYRASYRVSCRASCRANRRVSRRISRRSNCHVRGWHDAG